MHILHKSIPNQIFPNANYTLFLGKIQSSSLKAEAVFIVALTSTLVTTIVSLCLNFPLHRAFPLTTCARTGTKKKYLASGAFVSGYNSSLSVCGQDKGIDRQCGAKTKTCFAARNVQQHDTT